MFWLLGIILLSAANAYGQLLLDPTSASGPLSNITASSEGVNSSITQAYSIRQLKTTYDHSAIITPPTAVNGYTNSTSPIIRVRRSFDDAQLDIGYTSGRLDTVTLKNFVTGKIGTNGATNTTASGYISIWYDQSGNNRDAIQTTLANQPRIINAGVIDRNSSGQVGIVFDGTDILFHGGTSYTVSPSGFNVYGITGDRCVNLVCQPRSWTNGSSNGPAGTYLLDRQSGGGGTQEQPLTSIKASNNNWTAQIRTNSYDIGGSFEGSVSISTYRSDNVSLMRSGDKYTLYVNGITAGSVTKAGDNYMSPIQLGYGDASPTEIYYGEFILFPTSLNNASLTALNSSQDLYFATGPTPATWTGSVSTDWNTAGNWSDNTVPSAVSEITIPSNVANSLVITSGQTTLKVKSISISAGSTVTINGNLDVTGSVALNGTIDGTGTLSLSGGVNQSISAAAGATLVNLVITNTIDTVWATSDLTITGTLNILSNAKFGAQSSYVINNTASGTIGGNGTLLVTRTTGTADFPNQYRFSTYALSGLTVNFCGAGNQTISLNTAGIVYYNLAVGGSGIKTMDYAIFPTNVTGSSITIYSGTLYTADYYITCPTNMAITVAAGATLDAATSGIYFGTGSKFLNILGTFATSKTFGFSGAINTAICSTDNPTITLGSNSTIHYYSTAAQTITTRSDYANIMLSGSGNNKTVSANITLSGDLTINSGGVLNPSTSNLTINMGGDLINNGSIPVVASQFNFNFNGTLPQSVSGTNAINIRDLTLSGTATVVLSRNITIYGGSITVNSGTTLTLGLYTANRVSNGGSVTVAGTLQVGNTTGGQSGSNFPSNYSSYNVTAGTVEYNGLDDTYQTIYPTTYNNLILTNGSGTELSYAYKTASVNITVNGTLTLNYKACYYSSIAISGSGTLTGYGTIILSSPLSTQFPIANKILTNITIINYASVIDAGTYGLLQLDGATTSFTLGGNVTVTGELIINSGKTLDVTASNYTLTVGGNFSNYGTFTPRSGTVIFNGSSKQTIYGPGTTFNNVTLSKPSDTLMFMSNINIPGVFNLGSVNSVIVYPYSSSLTINSSAGTASVTGAGKLAVMSTSGIRTQYKFATYDLDSIDVVMVNSSGTSTILLTGTPTLIYSNLIIATTSTGIANFETTVSSSNVTKNITVLTGQLTGTSITLGNNAVFTIASGATFTQFGGSSTLSMGTSGSVIINGTYSTSTTAGFSGGVGTSITSANSPTITIGSNSTIHFSGGISQTVTTRTDYIHVTLSGGTKTIGNGAPVINGNLTISSGATYNGSTNNPMVHIKGNFTNNGTFTQGTGLLEFSGTTTQSIGGTTATAFANSITFSGSGTATLTNTITVAGNLTVNSSKTLNLSTYTANRASLGGTLTVNGTLQLGNNTGGQTGSNFPTNYSSFVVTGGTVEYNGSNSITQTVYATTYNNLTLTNGSGTGTANKISTGNIGIGTGTFSIGYGVKFTPTAGNVITGSNGTLTGYGEIVVNGTATLATQYNITNKTLTNLTITYNGTTQSIPAGTYNTLTVTGTGTKTLSGNIVVLGTVNILTGNTFDASASNYSISVAGDWINNGTFTPRTGTVTFNGTSAQDISGTTTTTFSGVTISNTSAPVTLSSNINISGTLNINGTATVFTPSATSVINSAAGAGTITGTGKINVTRIATTADLRNQYKFSTYTLSSLGVEYSGAGSQTINISGSPTLNYSKLLISGSGTKTLDAAITSTNVTGDITISSGTFATGGFAIGSPANRTITVASGATLDASTSIITFGATTKLLALYGTLRTSNTNGLAGSTATTVSNTNTPTINLDAASTVEFYSGSAQAINTNISGLNYGNILITGSSDKTFSSGFTATKVAGRVTVNNGFFNVTLGGNSTFVCPFTLTSGRLVIGSNTVTFNDSITSSSTNIFTTNGSSNITFSGAGGTSTLYLNQTSQGVTNGIGTLTVNRSGYGLTMGNTAHVNALILTNNSNLNIGSSVLTLKGTFSSCATCLLSSNSVSGLTIAGTGALGSNLVFDQSIPGTSNTLGSLNIARSGQTVTLGSNLAVYSGGSVNITGGKLAIGNNTLTIDGTFTSDATNSLSANGTSSTLVFSSTGGSTTLYLDATTPGVTNRLGTLTFNRSGNTLTLGSNAEVATALNLTNGKLALGASTLTINGSITHSATNCLVGATGSGLTFGGTGGNVSFYMDQTTPGTTNLIGTLTINRASSTISLANDIVVGTSLALTTGKLAIGSFNLSLNGAQTTSATNAIVADGTSTLTIGGSGSFGGSLFLDQTTPGTTNCLNNLTYNRSGQTFSLGNSLLIKGAVTPTAGTLASGGFLTLVSNAAGTARVASGGCTTCSYSTGNFIVQRYVPAVARRWRFTGSNIQTATLADWKNELFITGSGGVSNGFDAAQSNAASVYWYDEGITTGNLNTGWVAATNISNPLTVGRGYRLFVRGDRSDTGRLTATVLTQNAVTLDLVGNVNQGDIAMPVTFSSSGTLSNDGWNFLSNPYPSPYDWNAHYDNGTFHANLSPIIYILSAQTGGYVSYNASSNSGTLTNGIIPSGAGFWVKAIAGSPSLTFKEQFKVSSSPLALFKTGTDNAFSIQVSLDSITSDELLIKYNPSASINSDMMDIPKLAGIVNISSYANDNVHLSLSVRPAGITVDTIKLSVSGEVGNYTMKFADAEALASSPTTQLLLIDSYLSTITDLSLTNQYAFTILSGIPASQGSLRFYILVNNSGTSLPVNFMRFDAALTRSKQVNLTWTVAQETDCDYYLIQRSADNTSFETIGSVKGGTDQSLNIIEYRFTDTDPQTKNYYRLKQVDFDERFTLSPVRFIQLNAEAEPTVYIYPTFADNSISVKRTLDEYNNCSITITDLNGVPVKTYSKPQWTENAINLNIPDLSSGLYILYLLQDGEEHPIEFKFIKR